VANWGQQRGKQMRRGLEVVVGSAREAARPVEQDQAARARNYGHDTRRLPLSLTARIVKARAW